MLPCSCLRNGRSHRAIGCPSLAWAVFLTVFSACSEHSTTGAFEVSALVFVAGPSTSGNADTDLEVPPVLALQTNGSLENSYSGDVTLTAYSDSGCTTPVTGGIRAAANPIAAASGIARFTNVRVLRPNVTAIGASAGSFRACAPNLVFTAGSPAAVTILSGDGQSAAANTALPSPLRVLLSDANGNSVSGTVVDWAIASGTGSLDATSGVTTATGTDARLFTTGGTTAPATVSATAHGTALSAIFSVNTAALLVNDHALNTNSTAVTLTLSAPSASTEMVVTNSAGCASGGNWEPKATTKNWTLGTTNAVSRVYAKFRSGGSAETPCLTAKLFEGTGTIVSEDFTANVLNADFIDPATSTALYTSGHVEVPLPAGGNARKGFQTYNADFTGASTSVEMVQHLNADPANQTLLSVLIPNGDTYVLSEADFGGGAQLNFVANENGSSTLNSIAFDATAHRFWRIRHDSAANRIHFETSPTGTTWTSQNDFVPINAVTSVKIGVGAVSTGAVAAPGTAIFDHFSFIH